jgi:hypothetical protein
MTKKFLNIADVLQLLHQEVIKAGGQSAWARQTGVNRSYLNKVLGGCRIPGPQIIEALNLKRLYVCAGSEGRDLIPLLREGILRAGSIAAWSRQTGIQRATASLVINGRRPPSARFFRALKQKKATVYVLRASKSEE